MNWLAARCCDVTPDDFEITHVDYSVTHSCFDRTYKCFGTTPPCFGITPIDYNGTQHYFGITRNCYADDYRDEREMARPASCVDNLPPSVRGRSG